MAVRFKAFAEAFVILNDAVVDHRQAPQTCCMWVRIDVIWRSMCGPPSMSDSGSSARFFIANVIQEILDFPFLFKDLNAVFINMRNSNTRAVIASVFKSLQPLD